jgi:isocitrate dehydrogenase
MLSIVKLMNGGGLFETGAGGSAPKHVQQLVRRRTTCAGTPWASSARWAKASASSPTVKGNAKAGSWATPSRPPRRASSTTTAAPGRKAGEPDNRDSHYWFARYWAEALAAQTEDADLAAHFAPSPRRWPMAKRQILAELKADRGKAGG